MKKLIFALALIGILLLSGCTTPSESEYNSTVIGGQESAEASTTTLLGSLIKEWRFFSILFVLISVGLISIAYPISSAFNMPDLKAWADVELGEAFSTALVLIFIISGLVFTEFAVHSYLLSSGKFDDICLSSPDYCPVLVAKDYLGDYMEKTEGLYKELQDNALQSGKLASFVVGAGVQYFLAAYTSVSWKPMANEMIIVDTMGQEIQFLFTIRDALFFQDFLLSTISLVVAPMCMMLGVILRSFFITRKLGGQMIAFGIGFLLVYPATYVIASYTMHATIYGAEGSGGSPGGEFCTQTCMRLPPVAYNDSSGEPMTLSQLRKAFPQWPTESNKSYSARINGFAQGQDCQASFFINPLTFEQTEITTCSVTEGETTPAGDYIVTCGQYNEICPMVCRTLPYPSANPECASWRTEFNCREKVDEKCFDIKYVDRNDPQLSGLAPEDFDGCPAQCRPLLGLKKEGCDIGYGFLLTESLEENPEDISDFMDSDGYSGYYTMDNVLVDWCHATKKKLVCDPVTMLTTFVPACWYEPYSKDECRDDWLPGYYSDKNASEVLEGFFDYEDVEIGKAVEWEEGCPNQCRFVTRDAANRGFGCLSCEVFPSQSEAATLWEDASNGDLETQIEKAKESCVMIIPDIVYDDPSQCAGCNYVLDKGFGTMPPVHLDCNRLCGVKGGTELHTDTGQFSGEVGGFTGSAEMKSITSLIVPAIVLPLLNLVITFMFIRTLSQILGGDIDLFGMMRLFR